MFAPRSTQNDWYSLSSECSIRPAEYCLKANNTTLHTYDWGNDSGRAVLMLHGTAQTAETFAVVAPVLSNQLHPLAYDLRGHGKSGRLPFGKYNHDDCVKDIGYSLDYLGCDSATLIAASISGLHCLKYAALFPDRVDTVILVDSLPDINVPEIKPILQKMADASFESLEQAVDWVRLEISPKRNSEQLKKRLKSQMICNAGIWRFAFDPNFLDLVTTNQLKSFWQYLPNVQSQIILVRGSHSRILDARSEDKFLHLARLPVISKVENAGHAVIGDNPDGFIKAISQFI